MRVLLSTIGTRGDVQPLVALATQLRQRGHEARLCVPPDFKEWLEGLGFAVTTIGPELRTMPKRDPNLPPPTPEQVQAMSERTVHMQFETLLPLARGCDVMVGATALQIAAPSVAETVGVPYVFVAYCPAVLPSRHHAPPVLTLRGDAPTTDTDHEAQWARDRERFAGSFGAALNARRASLGLSPVGDVRSHVLTARPWLAADPALAPWPEPESGAVLQTGAWLLDDQRPLAPELEAFLAAGEAPVYFGLGSTRALDALSHATIAAARAVGRRVIVARGWAEFTAEGKDCLVIGEVNQQALFPRVAAVVHHGGAGTTTAAMRAGVPQLVLAQGYDQYYFAQRVQALGLGVAHAPGAPTAESLAAVLRQALAPEVARRAREQAPRVKLDGAQEAAKRLEELAR